MPNPSDKPQPKRVEVGIDQLLAEAGVQTVSSAPPSGPTNSPSSPTPEGGAFITGDGRMLYRYKIDGGEVVLPKPIEQMSEEDFYSMPISLTDTQAGRIPQDLTVKFVDPQWAGHWFNRKAQDGRRVSYARSRGYVPAKREDCEWVAHSLNDEDGAIIDNDLVLMKIHKAKLYLQFKENMDKAKVLGSKESYMHEAQGRIGVRGGDKVSHYLTPQAEKEFQGLGPVTHIPTVS